ncbi:MAG: hypothetical protein ACJAY7_001610 [Pseudohongiellaceae bacterium]
MWENLLAINGSELIDLGNDLETERDKDWMVAVYYKVEPKANKRQLEKIRRIFLKNT